MAFEIRNFDKLSLSVTGNAPVGATYGSLTDNLVTIKASGYFNGVKEVLAINDFIMTKAADSQVFLVVTAITPNVLVEKFSNNIFLRRKLTVNFPVLNNAPIGVTNRFDFATLVSGTLTGFSGGVFTVPADGIYAMGWFGRLTANDNGVGTTRCPAIITNAVFTNGKTVFHLTHPAAGVNHGHTMNITAFFDKDDTVEFGFRQNSGVTQTFGEVDTFLNIVQL